MGTDPLKRFVPESCRQVSVRGRLTVVRSRAYSAFDTETRSNRAYEPELHTRGVLSVQLEGPISVLPVMSPRGWHARRPTFRDPFPVALTHVTPYCSTPEAGGRQCTFNPPILVVGNL
jgi:hypothetical protein